MSNNKQLEKQVSKACMNTNDLQEDVQLTYYTPCVCNDTTVCGDLAYYTDSLNIAFQRNHGRRTEEVECALSKLPVSRPKYGQLRSPVGHNYVPYKPSVVYAAPSDSHVYSHEFLNHPEYGHCCQISSEHDCQLVSHAGWGSHRRQTLQKQPHTHISLQPAVSENQQRPATKKLKMYKTDADQSALQWASELETDSDDESACVSTQKRKRRAQAKVASRAKKNKRVEISDPEQSTGDASVLGSESDRQSRYEFQRTTHSQREVMSKQKRQRRARPKAASRAKKNQRLEKSDPEQSAADVIVLESDSDTESTYEFQSTTNSTRKVTSKQKRKRSAKPKAALRAKKIQLWEFSDQEQSSEDASFLEAESDNESTYELQSTTNSKRKVTSKAKCKPSSKTKAALRAKKIQLRELSDQEQSSEDASFSEAESNNESTHEFQSTTNSKRKVTTEAKRKVPTRSKASSSTKTVKLNQMSASKQSVKAASETTSELQSTYKLKRKKTGKPKCKGTARQTASNSSKKTQKTNLADPENSAQVARDLKRKEMCNPKPKRTSKRKGARTVKNSKLSGDTKQSEWQCPVCQRRLTKNNKWNHMISHRAVKQYKCGDCSKSFVRSEALTNHRNVVHLKVKPYQCPKCGKRFARTNWKYGHEKTLSKPKYVKM